VGLQFNYISHSIVTSGKIVTFQVLLVIVGLYIITFEFVFYVLL